MINYKVNDLKPGEFMKKYCFAEVSEATQNDLEMNIIKVIHNTLKEKWPEEKICMISVQLKADINIIK